MEANFTIGNIFRKGWSIFTKNWLVLIGLLAAWLVITVIIPTFSNVPVDFELLMKDSEYALLLLSQTALDLGYHIDLLISALLGAFFTLVFTKALLDAYDEQELTFYFNFKKLLYLFLTTILANIIIVIGFVCFIIPGIYLAIRLQFYCFAIIDKDANPIESLKESWRITNGKTASLFLILLISIGICIAGLLLFIVGIVPAVIIILAAQAVAYKLLAKECNETLPDSMYE